MNLMIDFKVGNSYKAFHNGQERVFTILKTRNVTQYVLKWENESDPILILREDAIKKWNIEHGLAYEGVSFNIGKKYTTNKNGEERNFTVIEKRNTKDYFIKWDDNDQEVVTELSLLKLWTIV